MFTDGYRRVWRRRLRRRPLLPFLLAATVAVDVVLLERGEEAPLANGFVGGQLALLGVWVTWRPGGIIPRAAIAFLLVAAGLRAAGWLATGPTDTPPNALRPAVDLRGALTAAMIASLTATIGGAAVVHWLYRRRQSGLKSRRRRRFGVSLLLWATGLVAMQFSFGRFAEWGVLTLGVVAAFVAAEAFLTGMTLALLLAIKPKAIKLGLLVVLPLVFAVTGQANDENHIPIYYAVTVAFLSAWLIALATVTRHPLSGPAPTPTEPPPEPIDLVA